MRSITQFIRYGIVGISNTLLTAFVIWFLLDVVNTSDLIANPIGYMLGFLNSYYWNRKWTFHNKEQIKKTFVKFGIAFGIAFGIQYSFLYAFLQYTDLHSYFCQLISLLIYSIVNFLINKFYAFKV